MVGVKEDQALTGGKEFTHSKPFELFLLLRKYSYRWQVSYSKVVIGHPDLVFPKAGIWPRIDVVTKVSKCGRTYIRGHISSSVICHWGVASEAFIIKPSAFRIVGFVDIVLVGWPRLFLLFLLWDH
jgi:hypothetical protein